MDACYKEASTLRINRVGKFAGKAVRLTVGNRLFAKLAPAWGGFGNAAAQKSALREAQKIILEYVDLNHPNRITADLMICKMSGKRHVEWDEVNQLIELFSSYSKAGGFVRLADPDPSDYNIPYMVEYRTITQVMVTIPHYETKEPKPFDSYTRVNDGPALGLWGKPCRPRVVPENATVEIHELVEKIEEENDDHLFSEDLVIERAEKLRNGLSFLKYFFMGHGLTQEHAEKEAQALLGDGNSVYWRGRKMLKSLGMPDRVKANPYLLEALQVVYLQDIEMEDYIYPDK